MSDLISRSELIKDLMEQIPLAENVHIFRDIIDSQPTVSEQEIRDNAIEEFCKRLVEQSERFSTIPFMWVSTKNIQKIAEQMKEAGE